MFQTAPNGLTWTPGLPLAGDGGQVAVDTRSLAGHSIRYQSAQYLIGFQRSVYDAANTFIGTTFPTLVVVGGEPLSPYFFTPIALNAIDPSRPALVAGNGVYESFDIGDTLTQVAGGGAAQPAVAYGGRRDGIDNPGVLYIAVGPDPLVRTTAGGAFATVPLPTYDAVVSIVLNPEDWATTYLLGGSGNVYRTTSAGATWTRITGDLTEKGGLSPTVLTYVPHAPADILLAGTESGVLATSAHAPGLWEPLGSGLPHAPVLDMDYDPGDDMLVAGTLGRGAWKLDAVPTLQALCGIAPALGCRLAGESWSGFETMPTTARTNSRGAGRGALPPARRT